MSVEKSKAKKKWLLGCGITFVIVVIIITVGIYFVINKAKSILGSLETNPPAYTNLLSRDDFTPPSNGVIQEEDLKFYLTISREIQSNIDEKFKDEDPKFDWKNDQNYLNVVAKLYDIREIQADIIEKNRFSVKKYKWITRQLVIIFGGNLVKQMNMLIRVRSTDQIEIDSSKEISDIPQENLDLFNRYENDIQEVIGVWVLGI